LPPTINYIAAFFLISQSWYRPFKITLGYLISIVEIGTKNYIVVVSKSFFIFYSTAKEGKDYAQSANHRTVVQEPLLIIICVSGERRIRHSNSSSEISIKQEKVITWIASSMRFEYFKLFMKKDYGDFLKETRIKS